MIKRYETIEQEFKSRIILGKEDLVDDFDFRTQTLDYKTNIVLLGTSNKLSNMISPNNKDWQNQVIEQIAQNYTENQTNSEKNIELDKEKKSWT